MRRLAGATLLILLLGSASLVRPVARLVAGGDPVTDARPLSFRAPAPKQARSLPDSPPVVRAPSAFANDPLVFLSTAPAESLEVLPGIGPVLARRLVDARESRGPFVTWKDVDRVTGIGPRTLERLRGAAVPD
jgi:competence protein ComEA